MSSAKLSPESPQWHDAGQEELSNGLISARIGPAEAKYVRLTFNVRSPGRIFSLGIYSAAPVSDFTMPRARKIAAASSADARAKLITILLICTQKRAQFLVVQAMI